jgi:hypothetical protein
LIKSIRYLFLLMSLALSISSFAAQDSTLNFRDFNSAKIDSLKKLPDFNYKDNIINETAGLWERFWSFVWYLFNRLFFGPETYVSRQVIYIILGTILIGIIIYQVLKYNKGSLTSSNSLQNPDLQFENIENINTIDFDVEINKAISVINYRLALRLMYLKALKKLSDKEYINWDVSKTNSQYYQELQNESLKNQFIHLTYKFEYTWYGNLPINQQDFIVTQSQFSSFYQDIK